MISLHFYAFQLVLLCALLVLLLVQGWFGGSGARSARMDTASFIVVLCVSALYLYVATGKVYGVRRLRRLLAAGALVVAAGCVVLGYRFFLFIVTLYGT